MHMVDVYCILIIVSIWGNMTIGTGIGKKLSFAFIVINVKYISGKHEMWKEWVVTLHVYRRWSDSAKQDFYADTRKRSRDECIRKNLESRNRLCKMLTVTWDEDKQRKNNSNLVSKMKSDRRWEVRTYGRGESSFPVICWKRYFPK